MSQLLTGSATRTAVRHWPRVAGLLALALGLGALVGVLWWLAVDLPGYRVDSGGRASTSERGLAGFIGGDAWFALLGFFAGLLIGWLAWAWLNRLGWPVVLVAAVAAEAAALVCWLVGYHLGPTDFTARLAAAPPGQLVEIELTLRAKASLLVWPFAATVPVLLASSLGPDEEQPRPLVAAPWLRSLWSRLSRRPAPPEPPSP